MFQSTEHQNTFNQLINISGGIQVVGSDVQAFIYLITSDLLRSKLEDLYYINDYNEVIANKEENVPIDVWSSSEKGVYRLALHLFNPCHKCPSLYNLLGYSDRKTSQLIINAQKVLACMI